METRRPKRKIKLRHVLMLLLVYLLAAACGFVMFGGLAALPLDGPAKAAPGYRAAGNVQALRVQQPTAGDTAGLRAHFDGAVAFAKQNGYNTLIFEAKSELSVWWRDGIFPAATALQGGNADPLAQLFAAAEGQDLQVWLEVDLFAGSDAVAATQSDAKAAKHLAGAAAAPADGFDASDEDYRALLVESLSALPVQYPVGGFVLSGFGAQTSPGVSGAEYSLAVQATVEALHTALAEEGRLVSLSLDFDEKGGKLDGGFAAKLADDGLITYLLPQMASGLGDLTSRLARFGSKGLLASPMAADETGLFLFMAARSGGYTGTVLGTYPATDSTQTALNLYKSVSTPIDAPLPDGFDLPQLLGISYPAQNAKITTEQVFVMGTSDPAQPLYLNGGEVAVRAGESGVFGVAVDLEMGDNSFTFAQGDRTVTLNVVREEPPAGETPTYPADGTNEAKNGQAVVVTAQIASALKDPANPGSINETFPQGATFVIDESLQIKYDGATTRAYKLKSGDYVLGNHCRLVSGDGATSFTGLAATADEKGEWLDFVGGGAPGAYVAWEEGNLRLTFYDTTFDLPEGFTSQHVTAATVEENGDGSVTLVLAVKDMWGYSLEYVDGATRLYIKGTPQLGSDPLKPLEGMTIMLDPGHGDTDAGSPGVLWDTGPHEKDINLALAQAVSYRLQQLGATVVMTREGDTFPTLYDRLGAQTQQKPDLFLSLHHNARNPDADLNDTHGVEGYYFHPYDTPRSHALAQNLTEQVAALTGRVHRKDADWGYYYVTRTTVCPSVLFEYGFAMNPAEYTDITSADGIYAAAFATAQAIVDTVR